MDPNKMDLSKDVLLLTPGPTPLHPRARAALSWPMRGHLDPDVLAYNDRVVADLHQLYRTAPGAFTCLVTGTGSLGMEAGFANLLEPGERVLIAENGVFGQRMLEMATRLGAEVVAVSAPAGEPIDPEAVRRRALETGPKLIAMVHGETSSGVRNPVQAVGEVAREVGALYAVDAVTTVGMLPFDMAGWGVDYAYTGSQKCLSAPPGLAPVAFSARAMQAVRERATPVPSWYCDALGMEGYWGQQGRRSYHHTVPVQLHWATGEAIRAALEEGVARRQARARAVGRAALRALEVAGFRALVPEAVRLETVLAVVVPPGVDEARLRQRLRDEHFIAVAGGLGATAGRIWRLGLMGEGAHPHHYGRLLTALAALLDKPEVLEAFAESAAVA